jgi:hypothetical protein
MHETLDSVITAMYETVTYEAGGHPDWEREAQIFAPNARLVRMNDSGIYEFDLKSYRSDFEKMIGGGELTSFWEAEIWREERVFGDMAHVLSAYETKRTADGPVMNRGVNSIQLYRKDGRWWIAAMIWRREGKDVKIPLTASSSSS